MCIYAVASLAEAWIEIKIVYNPVHDFYVASLAEAWIEIVTIIAPLSVVWSRLPRGGVD